MADDEEKAPPPLIPVDASFAGPKVPFRALTWDRESRDRADAARLRGEAAARVGGRGFCL